MDRAVKKRLAKERRHKHILKKIKGTPEKPRVVVFASNRYFYLQAVDDYGQKVITGASTLSPELKAKVKPNTVEGAAEAGKLMAKRLAEKGIKKIVFDRAGYKYHGKVKASADAMRKEGVEF